MKGNTFYYKEISVNLRGKEKTKVTGTIMLMLILISTLSITFNLKLVAAETLETRGLNNSLKEINEITTPSKNDKAGPAKTSDNPWHNTFQKNQAAEEGEQPSSRNPTKLEDERNFNKTNEWGNFTFVDGNLTRIIVGINNDSYTNYAELEKLANKHDADIVNTVTIKGQIIAAVVEISIYSVSAFIQDAYATEFTSYIEPNMKVQAQLVPNDPYWSMQWGPQKIEADWAWNTTVGDPSVLVAVVDAGIYYTHPDLAANYAPLGYDWVNMDDDPLDDYGHGTHCAGIIAAVLNNSVGIAGLAQVRVMAEKVLDSGGWGYWDWIASGVIHATDCGAGIISMSLGGYYESELVHEAVRYAYDAGVLVIAAAGNEATSIKLYPAGYDEVVAVAATDQYDNTARWSNYGEWIELAAPGVDIYSTVPWGYTYASGTSMATPHVSGVAALVWSRYPNKTRDWVRLWLRCTADDLGDLGLDIYYGYGRVNARNAVEQTPPAHELIAYEWRTPPYVEPGALGIINATVLNFGENNETDVIVQLSANDSMVDYASIGFLAGGNSTTVSLAWNPVVEGLYNVTLYVVPVPGETSLENNVLWKYIYVGFPSKAVVLHSAGNVFGDIITNWQVLNSEWRLFGDTMVYVDYTTLNKEDITYEDIVATEADVLIISCASDPYSGWEFTDSEIEAIERYVHEGHGLIATAGTLYYGVPNNNKLASLFGLDETIMWDATWTDLLHLVNMTHPIFTDVPNPLVFPQVGTALPYDGQWDSNELVGGKYLALGHYQESAIVTFRGLVYISPWLEILPAYYHHHLQLLYNAITWSQYQKPEHDLTVSLQCPIHLDPGESILVNATVGNMGLNNETNVELLLLVNGVQVANLTVPTLAVGESETLSYLWVPTEGTYNVTAYAHPVLGEEYTFNNVKTMLCRVSYAVVIGFIETHGETLHSDDLKVFYESLGQIVNTIYSPLTPELLADYDVLIVGEDWSDTPWSSSEIAAVQDFILSGKGFVGIADELAPSVQEILGEYGMTYTGYWGYSGSSNNLDYSHPIMEGVNYIYVPNPVNSLETTPPGYWIANDASNMYTMITGAEVMGHVLCMSDDFAAYVYDDDNEIMFANMIYWMKPYEHDLAVSLNVPEFLEPCETTLLNATVYNRGLSNETDVELQLLINGTVANSTLIPELLTGASYTLTYLWHPTVEGTCNITTYAPPVPNEEYTGNNVASVNVKVRYLIAQVAVLNSWEIPPYFTGGWNNDYQTLVDALNAQGFHAQAVTNEEIVGGILSFFDVFVMVDNVPNDAAVPLVVDFWSNGGGIVAFDSSICFLCYAGILPPESAGSNGYYVYWDYETSYQARVSTEHPITEGYEVGQIIYGTGGDAEYRVDALATTSAYPYYTMLVEDITRLNRAYVSAYEPPFGGKVVHIWDQYHWGNTDLQLMILNAMAWSPPYERDVAIYNVTASPTQVYVGQSVNINVTVANEGEVPENFTVRVYWENASERSNSSIAGIPSEPHNADAMWVEPSFTDLTTAAVGYLFNVTVAVNMTLEQLVGAWQTKLLFDPTYVEAVRAGYTGGTQSNWFSGLTTLPVDPIIDNVTGYVLHAESLIGLEVDNLGAGTLFWIEFNVTFVPSEPVTLTFDITTTYPDETFVLDENIEVIPMTTYDGTAGTSPPTPPPQLIGEQDVYLLPESNTTLTFTWNTTSIPLGNYTIKAVADPVPYETDIEDNTFVDGIVEIFWQHDVALIDVSPSRTWVYESRTVTFNVTARNEGDFTENMTITLYYNITSGEVIGEETIVNLLPGENRTVTLVWNTTGVTPCFNYTITAVATIDTPDNDPADDTLTDGKVKVRILGDINGDGKVDIKDIRAVAKAFGSYPGHERWNPDLDFSNDGKIDMRDIRMVSKHFGECI